MSKLIHQENLVTDSDVQFPTETETLKWGSYRGQKKNKKT